MSNNNEIESYTLGKMEEDVLSGGAKKSGMMSGNVMNSSFVEYMTSFSHAEKSCLLNLVQYTGLALLPIAFVLRMMQIYVPEEDNMKPSTEIVLEVVLQLLFVMVALFMVHKLVVFVPTYSKVDYESFSLLAIVLPLLFMMFALDTKLSEKVNILLDRMLSYVGLKQENFEQAKKPAMNSHNVSMNPSTSSVTVPQTGTSTTQINALGGNPSNEMGDRLLGGHNTMRDSGVEQFAVNDMYMQNEPVAANESFGSVF